MQTAPRSPSNRPSKGERRATQADGEFFRKNPQKTEYRRPAFQGEAGQLWPPGTMVVVKRTGLLRLRAFFDPQGLEVRN